MGQDGSFGRFLAEWGRVAPPSRKFLLWLKRHGIPEAIVETFRQGVLQKYKVDPKDDLDPPDPFLCTAQDIMAVNGPGGIPWPIRDGLLVIGMLGSISMQPIIRSFSLSSRVRIEIDPAIGDRCLAKKSRPSIGRSPS